jgi:hypothetical protein
MSIEAIELYHVTGAALFVRYFVQCEIGALMLLMARCAVETTRDQVMGGEGNALRPGRFGDRYISSDFHQALGALLENLGGSAVRIEGRAWHFVAGKTGLAIGKPIAGHEAVKPAKLAAAAFGVAGATFLNRAMSACYRSRHPKMCVLGEKERRDQDHNGYDRQRKRQTIAVFRCKSPFCPCRFQHHQAPNEKA